MTHRRVAFAAVRCFTIVTFVASPIAAADLRAADPLVAPHVRTSHAELRDLVAAGQARSDTFRALVARIDASDVVVYLEYDRATIAPDSPNGQLLFVCAAGGHRYLVVRLRPGFTAWRQLELLAHELRHAVEIADAPDVVDRASLLRHYLRIGVETVGSEDRRRRFETSAAKATETDVRREVAAEPAAGAAPKLPWN